MKLTKLQIEALIAKAKPVLLAREKKRFAAALRSPEVQKLAKEAARLGKEQTAAMKASSKASAALMAEVARRVRPQVGHIQVNSGSGRLSYAVSNWHGACDNELWNEIMLLTLDKQDIEDMDKLFKALTEE